MWNICKIDHAIGELNGTLFIPKFCFTTCSSHSSFNQCITLVFVASLNGAPASVPGAKVRPWRGSKIE